MQVFLENSSSLPPAQRRTREHDCLLVFVIHLNVELLVAATRFGWAERNRSQVFKRNTLARLTLQHQMCLVYEHVLRPVSLPPTRMLFLQQEAQTTVTCTGTPASHTPSCTLTEGSGQRVGAIRASGTLC